MNREDEDVRNKYNEVLVELTDKTVFLKAHVRAALMEKRTIARFKGNLSSYWFYTAGEKDVEESPKDYKKWLDDYNCIIEKMLLHLEYCPPGRGYLEAQSSYNNLRNGLELHEKMV